MSAIDRSIESLGDEISEIVGRPVYVELRRRLSP